MAYDFCLGCGVLLSPSVYECTVCDFDNSFGQYDDILINDDFLDGLREDFNPEDESCY